MLRANNIKITYYTKMLQAENTVVYFLGDPARREIRSFLGELWDYKGDIMEINPPSHSEHTIPGSLRGGLEQV